MYHFLTRFALVSILMLSLSACKGPEPRVILSPTHYDFAEVITHKLDLRLKEISGLYWDTDRNEFLAHNDERGTLFVLDRESKDVLQQYEFAQKGDFEDVAMHKGTPYVLESKGIITRIIIEPNGVVRGVEAGRLPLTGTNDFETMYTDTSRNALVIICKNCDMDNKESVSAFAFYPDGGGFDEHPLYTIDAGNITAKAVELGHKKTSKFQPSAASIHPVLQKLFIISSASSQLVVADLNGNVEEVYELGKKLFPQPEGLTFKNNGDMYISNEGITSRGSIIKFIYHP